MTSPIEIADRAIHRAEAILERADELIHQAEKAELREAPKPETGKAEKVKAPEVDKPDAPKLEPVKVEKPKVFPGAVKQETAPTDASAAADRRKRLKIVDVSTFYALRRPKH